ncbi:MAG: S8 family serine peptidase, partial [Pyrinomonadaceae bacterium]|nr:S8 family serine peptidase [Pyrinomonadaceae bacterium]
MNRRSTSPAGKQSPAKGSSVKRNILLAAAALIAIASPLFLLPKGHAQRASLNTSDSGEKAAKPSLEATYRSPGDRHKVEVSDAETARMIESNGGILIADYKTSRIYETNSSVVSSLSGNAGAQIRDEDNLLQLNAGAIDTTKDEVQAARKAVGSFAGKRMHLVQFAGPIKPEWYRGLEKTGVEIVTYIPSNSYLVYGDARSLSRVQALSASSGAVQWDGEYKSEYRLDRSISAGQASAAKSKGGQPVAQALKGDGFFAIQMVKDEVENANTLELIEKLQLEPIKSQTEVLNYVNVIVRLATGAVVKELSQRGDVVSIQPWFMPTKRDERQNQIIAGNLTGGSSPTPGDYLAYLLAHGFTFGSTSTFGVNVSDSGVDNATTTPNHFGLYKLGDPTSPANSRVVYNRLEGTPNGGSTIQGCDGHGNLNTHIVGGYVPTGGIFAAFPHADAAGFRYGLGVAPFVKFGSSVIFDPNSFTFPDFENLESKAYNDGMRISTNSWGSANNAYSVDSQAYDALVRDAQPTGSTFPVAGNQEYVIVFAAGNNGSGSNTVGTPSTGKNVITVGASEGVQAFGGADGCGVGDTGADNANDIIGFSSRGPTSDGRKKPDIVAPGTHISGGVAQAAIASPTGSGTGAQIACFSAGGVCGGTGGGNFFPGGQQWYTASSGTSHSTPAIAGYAALIRQFFINQGFTVPTPAMTKALMMNSARYLNGVGANDTLPSNNQGMGEANFNSFFDIFATANIRHDQTGADKFTASGQQRIVTGLVSDNTKGFRVTLAWTDAPGPTSGNAFVNNLDLEVTVGGNAYKGNVYSGANSVIGGLADTRNNVESVFIPAGVSGSFIVKVKGTNIAGNGVPGDADPLDQDYALVIYNATEAALPVINSGATALTAESCAPGNNAVDPGETVTINFGLSNIGTANTANLVATLLPGGGVSSPSGPQNYGVVVAGGPQVSRPFTFTATTNCGENLTATLHLQDGATDLGNVSFNFVTGALGATATATYSSGNIAVPIPDVSSVEVPINITDTGSVTDVNAKVRLNHTFDGDLVIELIGPDGTSVTLSQNRGGSGANYGSGANDCSGTHTVFDDAAATAISAGTSPFAGSFRPESPLSAFNGKSLNGLWKLRISDTAALDVGTIGCVQLEITRQRFVCCGVSGTPQISAGPATLVNESCPPDNDAIDPGESVTVNLSLTNIGDGATGNLVATLQTGGGVGSPSPPQSYGVLTPSPGPGETGTRDFSFTASGSCGGTITATWQLQDGVINLGTVTKTFVLGVVSNSTTTFATPGAITIPASGTGASTGAPATPYPSNITVAGVVGTVSKVTVTLKNMNHTFPDDVDVLLVGPGGQKLLLMSDAGGTGDIVNNTYTFDDAAAATMTDAGPLASGTFKPSNFGT